MLLIFLVFLDLVLLLSTMVHILVILLGLAILFLIFLAIPLLHL